MKRLKGINSHFSASLFFTVLFLIQITNSSVLAFDKEHHADDHMSDHMQGMHALKDDIPEQYQIMERTPIIEDEQSLQLGQKLFQQNCTVCHGIAGDGKGPAAAALDTAPANFLNKMHSATYGPGEKFWIIGHGSGKTGMPEFSQLTLVDRWHLVNYILHLQKNSSKETTPHNHL